MRELSSKLHRRMKIGAKLCLAIVIASGSFIEVASSSNLPPKKAQSPKANTQVCEIGGHKGFRPSGSDTCVVVSGSVQVTTGVKVK